MMYINTAYDGLLTLSNALCIDTDIFKIGGSFRITDSVGAIIFQGTFEELKIKLETANEPRRCQGKEIHE